MVRTEADSRGGRIQRKPIMMSTISYQIDLGIFSQDELFRLQLALESKISDDIAYIRIMQDEIETYHNQYDLRFLVEGKEILKKDVDLRDKVSELRDRSR